MITEDPNRLLTSKECADYLHVSLPFLESAGRRRGPKYIRLAPRCVRYRWQDIQDWINANTFASADEAARAGFPSYKAKRS